MIQNLKQFVAVLVVFTLTGVFLGNAYSQNELQNIVEFNLEAVATCQFDPEVMIDENEPIVQAVCGPLMPFLLDEINRAEAFCDQVFAGYRDDIPLFLRNQLDEPVLIFFFISVLDDDVIANANVVNGFVDLDLDGIAESPGVIGIIPPRFLQQRGFRAWVIPRVSIIRLNINFIPQLLLDEGAWADVIVHEVCHAMGHPFAFEFSNLNRASNPFGQVNFVGDRFGINRLGYGLTEYRAESGNPLASFVPLSQADGSAHLSTFDETFISFEDPLQELFLPAELGLTNFMSRTLRGMFADLGYKIRGVNVPGLIDIDGDGDDDQPLIVSPTSPGSAGGGIRN